MVFRERESISPLFRASCWELCLRVSGRGETPFWKRRPGAVSEGRSQWLVLGWGCGHYNAAFLVGCDPKKWVAALWAALIMIDPFTRFDRQWAKVFVFCGKNLSGDFMMRKKNWPFVPKNFFFFFVFLLKSEATEEVAQILIG